jgi:hypothetical protein
MRRRSDPTRLLGSRDNLYNKPPNSAATNAMTTPMSPDEAASSVAADFACSLVGTWQAPAQVDACAALIGSHAS